MKSGSFKESIVTLNEKLVGSRGEYQTGISKECQELLVSSCLKHVKSKPKLVADLFVLMFNTRDILSGKGERELFYRFFLQLFEEYPEVCKAVISKIPDQGIGSWKDLTVLADRLDKKEMELKETIVETFCSKLKEDSTKEPKNRSLVAKWAPREGKRYSWLAKRIANKLSLGKSVGDNLKQYRQLVSKMTKEADIPEVKMCDGRWDEINAKSLPSRCLKFNTQALLYQKKDGSIRDKKEKGNVEMTDAYHEMRIRCREKFMAHFAAAAKGEAKVNGKTLQPHEIVQEYIYGNQKVDALEGQWLDLRKSVEKLGSFKKFVVLSDVSGSMSGTPMMVSIALGILISETNHESFKNRVMTFSEIPTWHNLSKCNSLFEKVHSLSRAVWGGSTNFEVAYELILNQCVKNKVSKEDMPEALLVLSDMQFDAAMGYYERTEKAMSYQERVKKRFKEEGYDKPPTIIFWNLRGNTKNMPAKFDTEGVIMVSGFSPAILKYLINGEDLEKVLPKNSYDLVRLILDDPRYDDIRNAIKKVM
jgi:hypothetical protein